MMWFLFDLNYIWGEIKVMIDLIFEFVNFIVFKVLIIFEVVCLI